MKMSSPKINQTHFVRELPDGKFQLEDNPEIVLSIEQFKKFQDLVSSETGLWHKWIIYRDYKNDRPRVSPSH